MMMKRLSLVTLIALVTCSVPMVSTMAQTIKKAITVQGMDRVYYLHVPPDFSAKQSSALVVVFHGGRSNALKMERFTRFSALADREGFLVVYPEAYEENWNDGRVFLAAKSYTENVDDVAFVAAMLDDISRQYPVDPRRIYATGISNGGIMSNYVGSLMADRFAAIAPVAGGISDQQARRFNPSQPVSVLIIQGTDDPILAYGGGAVKGRNHGSTISTRDTAQLWARTLRSKAAATTGSLPDVDPDDGCTVTWQSWPGPSGTEVRLMMLNGGGHTWPGGKQYLPKFLVGRVCRDFDATELIWDFFKEHPKS